MREADVGSQSADTIKLRFSSFSGRKQKTRQREASQLLQSTYRRSARALPA
jgi:hypothetical protein